MKSFLRFIVVAFLIMGAFVSVNAQSGISVTCDSGGSFDNGVEFTVNQMRPGFSYTATAIGLDGFDPVLAVLDDSGSGLCNDDSADAAQYAADLPSTGRLSTSGTNAQVTFSQNAGQMADVSLVVGGFGNQVGEFLLILEGMASTSADGAGDPFSIQLTPDLTNSSAPLSVYMIGIGAGLDPLTYLADSNLNPITDDNGAEISCDDAGDSSLCWNTAESLTSSSITRGNRGTLNADERDAMMQIPLDTFATLDFDEGPWFLNFIMTSYNQETTGDYLIAFHVGTGESVADTGGSDGKPTAEAGSGGGDSKDDPPSEPTPTPGDSKDDPPATGDTGGISVTCDEGGGFDNGVEFVVNLMRPGFSYTATVIGIDGFDPVLAVLDSDGSGLCSDDAAEAANYTATLPSSGSVDASTRNSQVIFSQTAGEMADISLVVGGYDSQPGEFILILEGMAATSADGKGDPFSFRLTSANTQGDMPLSVYMLGVGESVDPYFYLADSNLDPIVTDNGVEVACDDAGNDSRCWGSSESLGSSSVSRTGDRTLSTDSRDAMLQIPLADFAGLDFAEGPWYLRFIMSTFNQESTGDYIIAFHSSAP